MGKRILTNKYIAIKKCRHGYFAYYVNDLFVSRSLDLYGEWSEYELTALGNIIKAGDVVIDVGAFIGTHSVFFGQKVYPKGYVLAIEPQRTIFNLLAGNVALNNLLNVRCLNVAIADDNRTCTMPILDPTVKQNFGGVSIDKFDQGEMIDTTTIDDLPLSRCNLIKIDVEGFEAKVLAGAAKTIAKFKPALYVECNHPNITKNTLAILEKFGYKCYWHIFVYFNENNFFKNTRNVFAKYQPEANLLCFPKEAKVNLTGFIKVNGVSDNWIKALKRIKTKSR